MLSAFAYTLRNLRTNFFQTLLSVLGVIIGVGALVAMLSMIDGLEAYARETISEKAHSKTSASVAIQVPQSTVST